MPINILHITPHLGGGVGRVVLNYLLKAKENNGFSHSIICLDFANENAISVTTQNNIPLKEKCAQNPSLIIQEIEKADVVLVHWWNHPLLYDFLVRQDIPLSRIIFWSHISGFHPPYVFTEKALCYPDFFVFTTPLSFECEEVKNFSGDKSKFHTVWSTGGLEHIKPSASEKDNKNFNIGYIGTVDYCKIHPDFLQICSKINIPNAKFIVCGGSSHKEVEEEAKKLGIADKFEFTGLVSDINTKLFEFDIFGYPLAPYHYGTCDQVLAESMAAGVVPVVLGNPMEKYMVKDKETGLVAKDIEEYISLIELLYKDSSYRQKLSEKAKNYAYNIFSLEKMVKDWEEIFYNILKIPKSDKKWDLSNKYVEELSPADIFLEALGDYGELFRIFMETNNEESKNLALQKIKDFTDSPIWKAKTRGTPQHYFSFFGEDENLKIWSGLE